MFKRITERIPKKLHKEFYEEHLKRPFDSRKKVLELFYEKGPKEEFLNRLKQIAGKIFK